nr:MULTISPECIES: hypothetical protein [Streptomyces]
MRTDLLPLLPDRTLRMTRTADREYEIKLTGTGSPAPAVNRVDMILERCARPDGPVGVPSDEVDLVGFEPVTGVPAWQRQGFPSSPEPERVGLSPVLKEWKSNLFVPPAAGPVPDTGPRGGVLP